MIEHLDNNEQILLMYLADELPPDDRAEVEQMLATDATLRADLEGLRATQGMVTERLGLLDAAWPLPVSAAAAARQAGRDVRQWLARRATGVKATAVGRGRRSWGWALPAAVAAAIVVASALWVSRHWPAASQSERRAYVKGDNQSPGGPDASQPDEEPVMPQPQQTQGESSYSLLIRSLPAPALVDEAEPVVMSYTQAPPDEAVPLDDLSQFLLHPDATQ